MTERNYHGRERDEIMMLVGIALQRNTITCDMHEVSRRLEKLAAASSLPSFYDNKNEQEFSFGDGKVYSEERSGYEPYQPNLQGSC